MARFIDTHCHIIPAVDDGPADLEVSLEMARIAAADGIGTIIATPHIVEGIYNGRDRRERLDSLKARLESEGIDLDLVAGAEVPMSACVSGDKDFLTSLTLGDSKYLLVETADTSFEQLSRAIYEVRLCGLFPVLAHPERTAFVQKDPDRLKQALANGDVFCQITSTSIEGLFGKTARKAGLTLLRSRLVHLVASDAHSAGRRKPVLSESHRLLIKEIGEKAASIIMFENPQNILKGGNITGIPREIQEAPKQNLFAKLFHKTGD